MNISRRMALRGMAAAAALPALPALGQVVPLPRERLEIFALNPARIASLRRGVAAMKARKPSDPTSWFFQGAIHDVTDEAIAAAAEQDPDVLKVEQGKFWKQCPHHGASSADFLICHRAYLYYFERILRQASGDALLSLPYWNYTDPLQRAFPSSFARAERHPVTGLPRNPLYDDRREQAFMFGLYELSDSTAGMSTLVSELDFFGEIETSGLAGGVADSDQGTKGLLESAPHDLIHFAIGGAIGLGEQPSEEAALGLMSSTTTAAFDPIFWVHHANIDRLWSVWDCLLPSRRWGMVPPKDWLEHKPWYFNDVGGAVVNQARIYYLDRKNLPELKFDTDAAACVPLSGKSPLAQVAASTGGTSPLAIQQSIKSFSAKAVAGQTVGKMRVDSDAAVTTELSLQALPVVIGNTLKNSVLTASLSAPRRIQLEIRGIVVEGVTSSGFDVYVNLDVGQSASRSLPNYVGTLALFGLNQHGHHGQTGDQRFDITRLIAGQPDTSKIAVSIVPFDLLKPAPGQPRLRRSTGLTFESIRLLVMEGSTNPIM